MGQYIPSNEQTIERLHERFIGEKRRITEIEGTTNALATISMSDQKKKENGKLQEVRSSKKFKYFECGKPGHFVRNCRNRKRPKR
ncbi:hypothetical protein P5V15_002712 [Pogonomyrmex californicus]